VEVVTRVSLERIYRAWRTRGLTLFVVTQYKHALVVAQPSWLSLTFIHLSCESIPAHACGRPASWLSLEVSTSSFLVAVRYFVFQCLANLV
jgi:hypothetical protein